MLFILSFSQPIIDSNNCLSDEYFNPLLQQCYRISENHKYALSLVCQNGYYNHSIQQCVTCPFQKCVNGFITECAPGQFLFRQSCLQFTPLNSVPQIIGNQMLIQGFIQIRQSKFNEMMHNVKQEFESIPSNALEEITGWLGGFSEHKYYAQHKTEQKLLESVYYSNGFEEMKKKYPMHLNEFKDYNPETFMYHNGLRFRSAKIHQFVKSRDIIDLGAYQGDSLVMLAPYTEQKIYSFEFAPKIIQYYNEAATMNNIDKEKYVLIEKGVSEEPGTMMIQDHGDDSGIIGAQGNLKVELTTVDIEQEKFQFKPGFIKADLEGHLLPAIRGAMNTIKKFRPFMSLAIYHTGEEFFDTKKYLESELENYEFGYEQETIFQGKLQETTLLCFPKELLD
ncbi:Methyltransferase [Hexamita inflata]|uniref:Methyltransferase n=1 Tax=Hexamita inflata TaxID=28002 RepID=A0ABP1HQT5_9EUKA